MYMTVFCFFCECGAIDFVVASVQVDAFSLPEGVQAVKAALQTS